MFSVHTPYGGTRRKDLRQLYIVIKAADTNALVSAHSLNKSVTTYQVYLAWLRLKDEFPVRVVSPTKLYEREN